MPIRLIAIIDQTCVGTVSIVENDLKCKEYTPWNFSAPHGAGRTMSRTAAKQSITLTQYENAMKGVYANIGDTAEVIKRIEPLYNFKAEDHV